MFMCKHEFVSFDFGESFMCIFCGKKISAEEYERKYGFWNVKGMW